MSRKKISRSKVRELHRKGFTDYTIAEKLGCTPQAIREIRNRELGLKPNFGRKHINYNKLWKDYWRGVPLDELAVKYGYATIGGLKSTIGRLYLER